MPKPKDEELVLDWGDDKDEEEDDEDANDHKPLEMKTSVGDPPDTPKDSKLSKSVTQIRDCQT